jgi:hypothetical protein
VVCAVVCVVCAVCVVCVWCSPKTVFRLWLGERSELLEGSEREVGFHLFARLGCWR